MAGSGVPLARVSFLPAWEANIGNVNLARLLWNKTAGTSAGGDRGFASAVLSWMEPDSARELLQSGFMWKDAPAQFVVDDVAPTREAASVGTKVIASYPGLEPYLWVAEVREVHQRDGEEIKVHLRFDDGDSCTCDWNDVRLCVATNSEAPSASGPTQRVEHLPAVGGAVLAPLASYNHQGRSGFLRYLRATLLGVSAEAFAGSEDVGQRVAEVEGRRSDFLDVVSRLSPYEPWLRNARAEAGLAPLGGSEQGHMQWVFDTQNNDDPLMPPSDDEYSVEMSDDDDDNSNDDASGDPFAFGPPGMADDDGPPPIEEARFEEASKDDLLDQHFPRHLLCPISMMPMRNPAVAADGHTYDRDQIARWLRTAARSPVTNAPLRSKMLFPNLLARTEVVEALEAIHNLRQNAVRERTANNPGPSEPQEPSAPLLELELAPAPNMLELAPAPNMLELAPAPNMPETPTLESSTQTDPVLVPRPRMPPMLALPRGNSAPIQ